MSAATTPPEGLPLPLEGIRVLELGMVFVLPYAITPLAALGADVVKVEAESRPDQVRWGPPPDNQLRADGYNHGGHFQMLNRSKRGITLDLTKPRGRETLLRLIEVSDVVAENFTPRVLRNMDLTYDRMREVNPRIILLSSSGFGQTGPWQNYRAYGPNSESVDGLMNLTGYPDGPPVRGGAGGLGVAFTDVAGAYFGTYSILAALDYRERTGEGQWLDLSHYEAGIATTSEAVIEQTMNGRSRGRVGNRDTVRAPQGVYPCTGDDRWIAISVESDQQFATLTTALASEALASDQAYRTLAARHANHEALDAEIGAATGRRDASELERELQDGGVDAAAVLTPRDVWFDAQLKHRNFFEMMPPPPSAPELGPRPFVRPSWRMSATPALSRSQAPEFGQHTEEVLREYLDMPDDEIASLAADGVTASAPRSGMIAREAMDLPAMVKAGRLREADPDYRARLHGHLDGNST